MEEEEDEDEQEKDVRGSISVFEAGARLRWNPQPRYGECQGTRNP
jgi:hypothetical protein